MCILKTDGTNCDLETKQAFELAGGTPEIVHLNELRERRKRLSDYGIAALPGGFSNGDYVVSGKILAVELTSFLKDELLAFIEAGKPVIGICNGFQVLVRTGLLPSLVLGKMSATLTGNDSGRFECRWVKLAVERSGCIWAKDLEGTIVELMVAHGEGKFFAEEATLAELEKKGQIVLRYVSGNARTQKYPENPNGSLHAIAGICDKTGQVFGLMPHPERHTEKTHHPNWHRIEHRHSRRGPQGLPFFKNGADFAARL